MKKISKAPIKIEYVRDGVRRAVYGEISKNKLEGLFTEEENFICLQNDSEIRWVDKEAILSVSELETKSCLYEKEELESESFAVKKELKIAS